MKLLSIIVPCYNEAENIRDFYDELMKTACFFQEHDVEFEIIYVDDGSDDGTVTNVRKLNQTDQRVHLVSFSRNFGKEAAIYAGLQKASGDYAVMLDCDLQDPPALLPEMFGYITEEGYDSSIEWADGKRAENVTAQIEGNQFALTWDSTYRYDYDLGESEEGEGGKLTGIFLLTARPNGGADGGLSICVDGEWYPYVYDSTAYWNGELSDNLATDADVSSMSEQELGELKENQTAVSSGLMGAFKEQGLDSAKIDESTGTVQMDNNVLFALDKSKLTDEGKAYLDQFLAAYVPVISGAIEEGKVSTIVVEGYTDSAGDEAYNLKLSEERAQTVADYIKAGYPELANVIEVVGNGENNLILDGEGKEDAAASRRVEVRYVLKTE